MPTRVCQFTDTDEWYAGSKTKATFKQPLDDWAMHIGIAHNRPVQGFEFTAVTDDPRTGVLIEDAPTVSPPAEEAVFTAMERKALRRILATDARTPR